ncbi:MAG: hypothetical protein ABI467_03405 [Kofleriaceae bacterium]
MSKDRASPFSKKHRRYWIPVTGGMVALGIVNILIGLQSYKPPQEPARMSVLHDASIDDARGTIGNSELPAQVMRAFAIKYPHVIPAGAMVEGTHYLIAFPPGKGHAHATFALDGSFVSED